MVGVGEKKVGGNEEERREYQTQGRMDIGSVNDVSDSMDERTWRQGVIVARRRRVVDNARGCPERKKTINRGR